MASETNPPVHLETGDVVNYRQEAGRMRCFKIEGCLSKMICIGFLKFCSVLAFVAFSSLPADYNL